MSMKIKNLIILLLIIGVLSSISCVYSAEINDKNNTENLDEYDSSSVELAQQGAKTIDLNSTDTWKIEKYNNKSDNYTYVYSGNVSKNPDGTYYIIIYDLYRYNGGHYEKILLNEPMILNAYPKINEYDQNSSYYFSNLIPYNPSEHYIAHYWDENLTLQSITFTDIGDNVKKLFAKYFRYNNTDSINRALHLAYLYLTNDYPYNQNVKTILDPSILTNDSVSTINLAKKMVQDVLSMKKLYTDENNITYYVEGKTRYYFKFYDAIREMPPRPDSVNQWTDEMNDNIINIGSVYWVIMPYYVLETWDDPINETPINNTTKNNTPNKPNTPVDQKDPKNPTTPNSPITSSASMKSTGVPIILGLLILLSSLGFVARKK